MKQTIEVHKDTLKNLLRAFSDMPRSERIILKMHYGLCDDELEYTLEEIGKKIGVGGGRIRQIEDKALSRLEYHLKSL